MILEHEIGEYIHLILYNDYKVAQLETKYDHGDPVASLNKWSSINRMVVQHPTCTIKFYYNYQPCQILIATDRIICAYKENVAESPLTAIKFPIPVTKSTTKFYLNLFLQDIQ